MKKTGITYKEGEAIDPTNLSKRWVDDYAARVATSLSFQPGGDIASLVAQVGGMIRYQHIDELLNISGSLYVHGPREFDIILPYYTSPTRDRFTIGHELGHYFLHSDQGSTPIIAHRSGSTRIEWEANWFAASLLMPRAEFTRAISRYKDDLAAVARHFGVSQEAVQVRKDVVLGT